jgi:hypothetical protein
MEHTYQEMIAKIGQTDNRFQIDNLRYYLQQYGKKAGDLIDVGTLRRCLVREMSEHFDYREDTGIRLSTFIFKLVRIGLVLDPSAIYTIYQAIDDPQSKHEFCEFVLEQYVRTHVHDGEGVQLSRTCANLEKLLEYVQDVNPDDIVHTIPENCWVDADHMYSLLALIENKNVLLQLFAKYRLLFSKYGTSNYLKLGPEFTSDLSGWMGKSKNRNRH